VPELALADPGLRRIATLMLPATFGLAATQINILVDTVLAAGLGDGPITWLALAFRLMQLPIGLFGVAIATANLARVSRDAATGDAAALRGNLASALRAAALLTLPASAGLIALREPIVRVLFEHGAFGPASTRATAAAVLCYALGLYAYSVVKIQVPTFYAVEDTRWPVVSSATAVGLKILGNFVLLALLPRAGVEPFLALALSTSLSAWTNMALLQRGLKRRIGSLRGQGVGRTTLQVAALSAVMGLACGGLQAALEAGLPGGGFWGDALRLLASTSLGVAIIVLGARWFDLPEARGLLDRLRRIAGGGSSR
jgi:putative peptidoglycan lipid II flippase